MVTPEAQCAGPDAKAFAVQIGCAEITIRRMEANEYKPSNKLALVLFEKLWIPELDLTNKMIEASLPLQRMLKPSRRFA